MEKNKAIFRERYLSLYTFLSIAINKHKTSYLKLATRDLNFKLI